MLNFMTVLQQLCAKVKIEKVTSVCCSTLTYIKTQSCFSEEKYIFNAFFKWFTSDQHFTNWNSNNFFISPTSFFWQ